MTPSPAPPRLGRKPGHSAATMAAAVEASRTEKLLAVAVRFGVPVTTLRHWRAAAGARRVRHFQDAPVGESPAYFPELLAASACALPMLLKPRNQTGDDPAKALPVVLLSFVSVGLHAPEIGACDVAEAREPFCNPRRSVVSDYR